MKKILLVLILFACIANQAYSAKQPINNTIYLSKEKFDSDEYFGFENYHFYGNKYHISSFNSPTIHLKTDTLICSLDDSKVLSKIKMTDSSYFEFWFRVYVDSSMANKTIGYENSNREPINIYWDNKLIASYGSLDISKNESKNDRIIKYPFPFNTGKIGFHDLVIKKYRIADLKNRYIIGEFFPFLWKDYNHHLKAIKEKDYNTITYFINDGFRFFLLCVFIISFLFYIIVERSKSFFWFSLFCFCALLASNINFIAARFELTEMFMTIALMLVLCIGIFSFLAFLFQYFTNKIPKRIFYYSSVLPIIFISRILISYFNIEYDNFNDRIFTPSFFIFIFILIVEIIIQIVSALKHKKRRALYIAIGVLQFLIVTPILLFFSEFDNWEVPKVISIYLVPISFLITIIYIIKDSFTDNIAKQAEVIFLTQANEKILQEQNIVLEQKVIERTAEVIYEKKIVEQKNTEILDSIEYAKRIQATILPPPKVVKKYLDDSFILYLPKDIVAGDFYWMETVGDWVLFAACDCTGHGVPGALVSVVCHNALNRAVKEYNKIMPAEILDVVAELVLENFSSDDDVKDGMDASVCALNTSTGELYWAGANNPLWLIRHAELNSSPVEITEYKPNKQPIGKFDDRVPYTNHKIEIAKGDTIYLFTDGYADQFGGERGKKLTKAKFKDAILNMQRYNLDEQKKYLLDLHLSYKGNLGQVDDICVIGVRV
ncbi:MAG: SpoIIE family protein phosphatase [Bacteroidota bacterium]